MEIKNQSRNELKKFFQANDKPTESQFAELIEGMINLKDDKIHRPSNQPLIIIAEGTDPQDTQELLHFYSNEQATNPSWAINQNPRTVPEDSATAKIGLSVHDPSGIPRMFIQGIDNGHAGFNTVTPEERLHVYDGNLMVENPAQGSANIKLKNPNGYWQVSAPQTELNNNLMGFYWHNNEGLSQAYLTLLDTGRIGIGTKAPLAKLDVQGGAISVQPGSTANAGLRFVKDRTGALADSGYLRYYDAAPNRYVMELGLSGEAGQNHLALRAPGNIGIGTSDPQFPLHVAGRNLTLADSANGARAIELKNNIGTWHLAGPGFAANGNAFSLSWEDDTMQYDPAFTVTSDGMVGIGSASPLQPLVLEAAFNSGKHGASNLSYGGQLAIVSTKPQLDFIDTDPSNIDFALHLDNGRLSFVSQAWDDVMVLDANIGVGIGTPTPGQRLVVSGPQNAGVHGGSQLSQGGILALESNAPQIDFIDTDTNDGDWAIRANNSMLSFIRSPWQTATMVINGAGDVGIGTNQPEAKLHVAGGAIKLQAGNGSNAGLLFQQNVAGDTSDSGWIRHYVYADTESTVLEIGAGNDATDNIALMPSGNLGIGTVAPQAKLDVRGGVLLTNGNNEQSGLLFRSAVDADDTGWLRMYARNTNRNNLVLGISNNPDDHISLMPSGNVGVKTLSPREALEVNGGLMVRSGSTQAELNQGIVFSPDPGTGSGDTAFLKYYVRSGSEATTLELGVGNDADDHLALTAMTGNIGVGTTNPTQFFTIEGAPRPGKHPDSSLTQAGYVAIAGALPQLDFIDTTASSTDFALRVDENKFRVIRAPFHTNDFVINEYGRVGIGTDNPLSSLHVAGGALRLRQGTDGGMLFEGVSDFAKMQHYVRSGSESTTLEFSVGDNTDDHIAFIATGNVGVGTNNPQQPFTVEGQPTGRHGGSDLTTTGQVAVVGNAAQIDLIDTDALDFALRADSNRFTIVRAPNNTEDFVVDAAGRVGIGTSSPTETLEVDGNLRVTGSIIAPGLSTNGAHLQNRAANQWYRIAKCVGTEKRAAAEFTVRDFISSGGHSSVTFRIGLAFGHRAGASFTLLSHMFFGQPTFTKARLTSNGTNDEIYLDVYMVRGGNVDFTMSDNFHSAGWKSLDWEGASVPSGWVTQEYQLEGLFGVGGAAQHIHLSRQGNLGLGTIQPKQPLDIKGIMRIGTTDDSDLEWGGLEIKKVESTVNYAAIGFSTGTQTLAQSNKAEALVITREGKVGVGTNTPSTSFEVNGDLKVSGTVIAPGFTSGGAHRTGVTEGNWYRIAEVSGGSKRASAEFTVMDFISGGGHSSATFRLGISYNDRGNSSFTLLNHSYYHTPTFERVRLLTATTYDTMYVEVFIARTGEVDFTIGNNLHEDGFEAVEWGAGSIPGGYTVQEFELDQLFSVGGEDQYMALNRSGNLGIGTDEPAGNLDVHTFFQGLEVIDQNHESSWTGSTLAINASIYMPFVANKTGPMTKLEVFGSALYYDRVHTVRIFEGWGTGGTVIAEQPNFVFYGADDSASSRYWRTCVFQNPPQVVAGRQYTWQLIRTSTYSGGLGNTSNAYPGGYYYSSGGKYYFMFRTHVKAVVKEPTLTVKEGKVGIRTANPEAQMHVIGLPPNQLRVEDLTSGNYWNLFSRTDGALELSSNQAGWTGHYLNSAGWQSASDARVKDHVEPIDGILNQVMNLKPVRYHKKGADPNQGKEWGFIAQEVEDILPELVDVSAFQGIDDMRALNYSKFSVVAIKAIQEQQSHIETLEQDLAAERHKATELQQVLTQLNDRLLSLERARAQDKSNQQ